MAALTVICVLGGPVDEEGVPKRHLALRLDQALREGRGLEAAGTAHRYLLTGGKVKSYGSAGVVTEASAMARYLSEHGGVAWSACLLEEEAVCTLTNAVHSKRLLLSEGLWSGDTTLLLVTSSCHMARAATCFCTVFPPGQIRMAPSPDPAPELLAENLAREALSLAEWFPARLSKLSREYPDAFLESSGPRLTANSTDQRRTTSPIRRLDCCSTQRDIQRSKAASVSQWCAGAGRGQCLL
jgi:hypothetical protein